jgi:hypothetical protein
MESFEFKVKETGLVLSSENVVEMKYLSSVNEGSYKLLLSSGGSIFDYKFDIRVRGVTEGFDVPENEVGRILSIVKSDVESNLPIKIHLNVADSIFRQLLECYNFKNSPKKIVLSFDDEALQYDYVNNQSRGEDSYFWNNLCRFRINQINDDNFVLNQYEFEM